MNKLVAVQTECPNEVAADLREQIKSIALDMEPEDVITEILDTDLQSLVLEVLEAHLAKKSLTELIETRVKMESGV